MTIKQLQFFVELARSKNFTKAADKLYITQPGLSYSIKQLENELATPLLNRHGSGVTLTHFGEAFLPYAETIINTLDNGLKRLKELSNPHSGTLTLSFISTLGENVILDLLNTFYSYPDHDDIVVILKPFSFSREMFENFESGQSDLMLYYYPPSSAISFVLEKQDLVLAVPLDHPLADRESVTLDDLAGEPLCYAQKDSHLYKITVEMFKSHGLEPNLAIAANDWISMITYTSLGKGLSIIPNAKFQNEGVKVIPLDNDFRSRSIYMCISSSNYAQQGVVKYFYETCRNFMTQ